MFDPLSPRALQGRMTFELSTRIKTLGECDGFLTFRVQTRKVQPSNRANGSAQTNALLIASMSFFLALYRLGSVSRTGLDWRPSAFGFHHPRAIEV
jgi:hypothetical protein